VGALIGTFGAEHVRLAIELGIEPNQEPSRARSSPGLSESWGGQPTLETSRIRLDEPCSDRTGSRTRLGSLNWDLPVCINLRPPPERGNSIFRSLGIQTVAAEHGPRLGCLADDLMGVNKFGNLVRQAQSGDI
jgi:hypothetical protein